MRASDQLLFTCTRQDFGEEHRRSVLHLCSRHAVDWHSVVAAAEWHKVAPVVGKHLLSFDSDELGIPPAIVERFAIRRHQNIVTKERTARRIAAALAWFNARGIDVMLLKGAALDLLVYREPWLTGPNDADLILRLRKSDPRFEATRGFVRSLYRDFIECDFFDHHDLTMNGVLPIDFERIWSNAREVEYREEKALVMSPEDLLLSLCINAARKRYFRLKSLCDLAEVLRRFPDLDWDHLARVAREELCEGIAYTALLTTRETVGCDLSDSALGCLGVGSSKAAGLRFLIRRQIRHGPIDAPAPGTKLRWKDRTFDASLLLSYAGLRGRQMIDSLRTIVTLRAPKPAIVPARGGTSVSLPPAYWHAASSLDFAALPRRQLGRSGLLVSEIGVYHVPQGDSREGLAALWRLFEAGINHFLAPQTGGDTVDWTVLSGLLQGLPRDEVVLGLEMVLPSTGDQALASARGQIEKRLALLHTDYADMVYLDTGSAAPAEALEPTLEALCGLREEGKIRCLGLRIERDGVCPLRLTQAVAPLVIQVPHELLQPMEGNESAGDLLEWAEREGCGVIAVAPLADLPAEDASARALLRRYLDLSPALCAVVAGRSTPRIERLLVNPPPTV